jgi:hypothetical protein
MTSLLWFLLALDTAAGNTFDINVNYQCTVQTPNGCTAWTQTGTVEESTACFPGDSYVVTQEGPRRLDALQMGDMILGHDASTGTDAYTPVRAWLHRITETPFEYIKLQTARGELEVSRLHNVAVVSPTGLEYQYAEEVSTGAALKAREGPTELLSATGGTIKTGLFAPLTRLSNFYVAAKGSASTFLVHSYAHVRYPDTLTPICNGILSMAEAWNPEVNYVEPNNADYVHPVASRLQNVFSFLVDKSARQAEVSRLPVALVMASA